MKRMHVHVSVENLSQSVSFYSTLFGAAPDVLKPDYAKWMLDDPRVNFAISERAARVGIDHLGIQVESGDELAAVAGRLKAAGETTREQIATTCCYAKSDKAWVKDPSGIDWETFRSLGATTVYGEDRDEVEAPAKSACCASTDEGGSAGSCC